jgi:hypothetical protein
MFALANHIRSLVRMFSEFITKMFSRILDGSFNKTELY